MPPHLPADTFSLPVPTATDRRTPLIVAAAAGHTVIVTLLLDKGAAINDTDQVGISALMQAASWGHEQVISL